jgi:two-component system, OmpR family, phosphate regulon sensor histidine kinase PhoR
VIYLIILSLLFIFLAAYGLSYFIFKRKISVQIQKMLLVMRADEIALEKPADAYEVSDDFFSDLERASSSLRRKYLRLKKNSNDERKAYETVFSGLKEGIVTVDHNLKIISFNTRFMQLFNWSENISANKVSNIYLQDIIRQPEVIESFKKIFVDQKIIKSQSEQMDIFISPLPSLDENQKWVMGVFYDLSETKKIDQIRVDFVANASHELRTPLTVIKGYSDLLLQKMKNEKNTYIDMVQPIVESTQNMTLLLDDLLNLSKLESSHQIQKEHIDIRNLTESILTEFDSVLSMNHKQIVSRFDANTIFADESGLRQVVRNLIVNAIRYSGPSAPTIFISWSQSVNQIFLSVKDTGPGIPLEYQDRIYERFYRVDKGRSRNQGGSGLGLALVKHQMLNHGGKVTLKSSPEGTEFICEFPKS